MAIRKENSWPQTYRCSDHISNPPREGKGWEGREGIMTAWISTSESLLTPGL